MAGPRPPSRRRTPSVATVLRYSPWRDTTPRDVAPLALAPAGGYVLWLAFLLLAQCFIGMSAYPLLDNNEGLYAGIARDMLHGSSLILPHANGVPYIEKPPLLYWLIATAISVFGDSAASVRLAPGLCVVATCLISALLMRRVAGTAQAWLTGLILASSVGVGLIGRTLLFDNVLGACLAGALACYFLWTRSRRTLLLAASYGLLGLAGMAKGLVGPVLGCLIIALHWRLAGRRDGIRPADLVPLPALAAFALTFLPWHIAMAVAHPDSAWSYLYNEHFLRFLDLRVPHDYYTGPPWYYVPRLLALLFPWTGAVALFFLRAPADPGGAPLRRFLWIWFWTVFLFFTLSRAKANYYCVIAVPPLAMLLAQRIELCARLAPDGLRRVLLFALGVPLASSLALLAYSRLAVAAAPAASTGTSAAMAIAALIALAVIALALATASRSRFNIALLLIALCGIPFQLTPVAAVRADESAFSSRAMGEYAHRHVPASANLYVYRDYEDISALPYYYGRRLAVVASSSNDLQFGQRLEGNVEWFPDIRTFLRRSRSLLTPIVVRTEYVRELERKLGRDWACSRHVEGQLVLLINRCDSRASLSRRGLGGQPGPGN